MTTAQNRKAKSFVVSALLDLPSNDAEWLAEIRTQIIQLGGLIKQHDPELIYKIVDFFESQPTPKRKIQLRHRMTTI